MSTNANIIITSQDIADLEEASRVCENEGIGPDLAGLIARMKAAQAQPSVRIEDKIGDAIEIVPLDAGGFSITAVRFMGNRLAIWPTAANNIIIEVK